MKVTDNNTIKNDTNSTTLVFHENVIKLSLIKPEESIKYNLDRLISLYNKNKENEIYKNFISKICPGVEHLEVLKLVCEELKATTFFDEIKEELSIDNITQIVLDKLQNIIYTNVVVLSSKDNYDKHMNIINSYKKLISKKNVELKETKEEIEYCDNAINVMSNKKDRLSKNVVNKIKHNKEIKKTKTKLVEYTNKKIELEDTVLDIKKVINTSNIEIEKWKKSISNQFLELNVDICQILEVSENEKIDLDKLEHFCKVANFIQKEINIKLEKSKNIDYDNFEKTKSL